MNAITDDPASRELVSQFSFQYIPTSLFIVEGEVADSYTGPLSESEMRARLDSLVAE